MILTQNVMYSMYATYESEWAGIKVYKDSSSFFLNKPNDQVHLKKVTELKVFFLEESDMDNSKLPF